MWSKSLRIRYLFPKVRVTIGSALFLVRVSVHVAVYLCGSLWSGTPCGGHKWCWSWREMWGDTSWHFCEAVWIELHLWSRRNYNNYIYSICNYIIYNYYIHIRKTWMTTLWMYVPSCSDKNHLSCIVTFSLVSDTKYRSVHYLWVSESISQWVMSQWVNSNYM